jgi:hypothetical protein
MKARYLTLIAAAAAEAIMVTTPEFRHETRSAQGGTALALVGVIFTLHLAAVIARKLLRRKAAETAAHATPYAAVRARTPR